MSINIQDYIHYYIGCRCFNTWYPEDHPEYDRGWYLRTFRTAIDTVNPYGLATESLEYLTGTDSIKLILRKLEDITQEECDAYNKINITMHSINKVQDQMKTNAATTNYLLKQGFDLFDLIHNGLAIDSKTLK